jgi:hypothetical protein
MLFARVIFSVFIVCSPLLQRLGGYAANCCYLVCVSHALKTFHSGSDHVLGVVGAEGLCTDILDACHLNDCTDSAAGDNTGTGCGGLEQNSCCAECAGCFVGDGSALEGYLDEVLLSILDALADCVGYFGGLAKAVTYCAVTVAYYYESGELEDTTTLNGLGNAVQGNDLFAQLKGFGIDQFSHVCVLP